MRIVKAFIFAILALMVMTSCHRGGVGAPDPARSVYYWRTTLSLDSAERAFLAEQHIGKMYVRFFDVVKDADGNLQPNATLQFINSVPDSIEVIPTVFITENCLDHEQKELPSLLVKRVLQMCETNEVKGVREMQIDFDWTGSNQGIYFKMLDEVRSLLKEKGMRLSVTIRLHQLALTPPPADYGVLMVYNTGDASKREVENPILNDKEVEPYLKYVADYPLPLCAAYPIFKWNLLFRGNEFKAILYDTNVADTTLYRKVADGHYLAISSRELPMGPGADAQSTHINPGDEVMVHEVSPELLKRIHDQLGSRESINTQVILYDLKSDNTKRYKSIDYETIYHP